MDIECLFNDEKKFSMGYNHAGCQCSYPPVDTDIFAYFGYSHLKHIHIGVMKMKQENKAKMWVAYNNVVAM